MKLLMKKYIIKSIQDNPDGFFRKRPEVVNLDEKKIQEILMDKARELIGFLLGEKENIKDVFEYLMYE